MESFACRSCGHELQLKYPNDRFNLLTTGCSLVRFQGKFKRRSRQCLWRTPKFPRPRTSRIGFNHAGLAELVEGWSAAQD